jgi:hypothetical protein
LTSILKYVLRKYVYGGIQLKRQTWQEAKPKMKRMVLVILVLLLMFDLAEDGCLGKATFDFYHPSAKTSVTTSDHPDSGQTDFQHELASIDLMGSPAHDDTQSVTLRVLPTLQIIHRCHLSSSGGIPL